MTSIPHPGKSSAFLVETAGVVARIVTGPHEANRQDHPHLTIRYDTGRPRSVIRLRISQPRTASLPCPAGLRARRPSPATLRIWPKTRRSSSCDRRNCQRRTRSKPGWLGPAARQLTRVAGPKLVEAGRTVILARESFTITGLIDRLSDWSKAPSEGRRRGRRKDAAAPHAVGTPSSAAKPGGFLLPFSRY